jgi:protein-S-isoprenylcysteine O-methyltransferase Ste14
MSKSQRPSRRSGYWVVVLHFALILLLVLGPTTVAKWPRFTPSFRIAGVGLMVGGIVFGAVSLRRLRPSLTKFGALKPEGALVTAGPYRLVRHPVYTAQILFPLGWSLALGGWLTVLYALTLSVLLNFKALMEERRLLHRFTEYRDYQARTRMFVPFIY